MKSDPLEQLLRHPVPRETPRPGFETRLRALSHHQTEPTIQPRRSRWWLATPFAALTLLAILSDSPAPAPQASADPEKTIPVEETDLSLVTNSPLHQEARELEKDAKRTAHFLFDSLPSISITKKDR
ncbi:MAG: hypothetical protein ACSHYF_13040 [Verrucomicrobiaceae bacterium]